MKTDTGKLRELLAKATPGEWFSNHHHPHDWSVKTRDKGFWKIADITSFDKQEDNAALIAAAVNALPSLLDEIELLRAQCNLMDRKNQHGCNDMNCDICDGPR